MTHSLNMDLLAFAVTLFLVIDPIGNAPVFHAVISRVPEERRSHVLARELAIGLTLLLLFLLCGKPLLGFLHLEPHTLGISGGIILFLIALGMVFPSRNLLGDGDEEPFIVPLAVPLIAGPSATTLLLLTITRYPGRLGELMLATLVVSILSAIILWFSPAILKLLGPKGSRAIERLMGMILILISVQMFMDGIRSYLHVVFESGL